MAIWISNSPVWDSDAERLESLEPLRQLSADPRLSSAREGQRWRPLLVDFAVRVAVPFWMRRNGLVYTARLCERLPSFSQETRDEIGRMLRAVQLAGDSSIAVRSAAACAYAAVSHNTGRVSGIGQQAVYAAAPYFPGISDPDDRGAAKATLMALVGVLLTACGKPAVVS